MLDVREITPEEVDPEDDFIGEAAVDLFIDHINPLSKEIHKSLKTTRERQKEMIESFKKQRAEQRAEEIREKGVVFLVLA